MEDSEGEAEAEPEDDDDDEGEAVRTEREMVDELESEDDVVSMEAMVEAELCGDDCRSEWARVYLVVLISSSRGVRKETRFSAGKRGREGAILRVIRCRAGLLVRMEFRLWGCV